MTTVTTYFARDLIDLGSLHDGQIGLSWWPGKAPVQVVDTPGASLEIGCPTALAAVLVSARNSDRLDRLEDRLALDLDGLEDSPDIAPQGVRSLVAAALA